jgi:urease accessory protein UreH
VGRRARLELRFEYRRGRTVLAHAYAEPPLRVGRVYETADAASLILVCAGPGMFGGDSFEQRIAVRPGARVLLQSQAALQIHPSASSPPAVATSDYEVDADAELYCHWDPVIPFARSHLTQRIALRVAPGARLYWADGMMAGRSGAGERWAFGSIDHELRLEIGGALGYLERYRLPAFASPRGPWIAADRDYVGTTIVCGDGVDGRLAETLHGRCGAAGVDAAVDAVEAGLLVSRIAGSSGPAWSRARGVVRDGALGLAGRSLAFRR